jgi:hypothetical protein
MKKINENIIKTLTSNAIGDEGIIYLLSIYFNLDVKCIPQKIQTKVNLLKIVERDYDAASFSVKWNEPLFEGESPTQSHWDWVEDWRKLFKRVNPERDGTKKYCITRMKKFFSKFPNYRKEDVMIATRAYLGSVASPQYCKKAHKFIFEGSGVNEYSLLLEWCERMKKVGNKSVTFKKMGE